MRGDEINHSPKLDECQITLYFGGKYALERVAEILFAGGNDSEHHQHDGCYFVLKSLTFLV